MKKYSFPTRVPKFFGVALVSILGGIAVPRAHALVPAPTVILAITPVGGYVTVRWTGTAGVLYQLESATSLNGSWQPVGAPTTAFAATNVISSPMAFYRVATYTNTTFYQANSTTYSKDKAAPPAPSGLSGSATSCTSASLSWNTVADLGTTSGGHTYTSGLRGYQVFRDGVFLKEVTTTSTSDTSLSGTRTYSFAVAAIDNAGNRSALSSPLSVTTPSCVTCSYSITSSSASFAAAGGAGSVGVNATAGCSWTATANAAWLHIASGASGMGNGTVAYSVDANTSTGSRAGTLTVAGQTFTVNQPGATVTCSYSLSSTSASHADLGGSGSVSVTTDATCAWTATANVVWITITSGANGTGNGTVNYSVAANLTLLARSGTMTIAGQTFTVNQGADVTAPSVSLSLSTLVNGTYAAGTVNLVASASDNLGVAKVEFYRDGVLFATNTLLPFGTTFDTRTLANGSHTFLARAYDLAGNTRDSSVAVTVDNVAPTASLTAPANSATLSGTANFSATATDNSGGSGIARVEFYCESTLLGTATAVPYTLSYDSTQLANGSHLVTCKAYDALNNATTSAAVTVTVNNTTTTATGQYQWHKFASGNGTATINGVGADRSGNIFSTGIFNSTDDFGGGSLTAIGSYNNAFLVKHSASGQFQWGKRIGTTTGIVEGTAMAADSAGNVYLVGDFTSTVDFSGAGVTGATITSDGVYDMFIVKYNAAGQFQWVQTFGGIGGDSALGVAVDSADNIVLTGYTTGATDFGTGPIGGAGNAFLAKFNNAGTCLWAKHIGGDWGRSVSLDATGNIVIAGDFAGTTDFGSGNVTSSGGYDIFLAKYAADGTRVWVKTFGGTSTDAGKGAAFAANGDVVLVANFFGTVNFGGVSMTAAAGGGLAVVRFNAAGTAVVWAKNLGSSPYNCPAALGVAVDGGGNVVLYGTVQAAEDFGTGLLMGFGANDPFLAKFSADGSRTLWSERFAGYGDNKGKGLTLDGSGNIIIGGTIAYQIDFGAGAITTPSVAGFVAKFAP